MTPVEQALPPLVGFRYTKTAQRAEYEPHFWWTIIDPAQSLFLQGPSDLIADALTYQALFCYYNRACSKDIIMIPFTSLYLADLSLLQERIKTRLQVQASTSRARFHRPSPLCSVLAVHPPLLIEHESPLVRIRQGTTRVATATRFVPQAPKSLALATH